MKIKLTYTTKDEKRSQIIYDNIDDTCSAILKFYRDYDANEENASDFRPAILNTEILSYR